MGQSTQGKFHPTELLIERLDVVTSTRFRTSAAVVASAALSIFLLAGCAPATPALGVGQSSTPGSGTAPAAGSAGKASCAEFSSSAFAALTTATVGKPFDAGSDSGGGIVCWYGIGKNANVSGSSVENLTDDNILITTIGFGASDQYAKGTAPDVNLGGVVPISGIGDKAAYNISELSAGLPQLYAVKGSIYCHVQVAIASSELVSSDPATVAKAEGALCENAFGANS